MTLNHAEPERAIVAPALRRGTIEVAPQAIATMAGRTVLEVPGIIGIAGRHLRFGGAELLPSERFDHGIDVHFVGERIVIAIHVIVEYGQVIPAIAHAAMSRAKAAVEQMLGLPVVQVNIIVQGLRVGDPTV